MSLQKSLPRWDSAPDLTQFAATAPRTEELNIIDGIIDKAVDAITTLQCDLAEANGKVARQQREIGKISQNNADLNEKQDGPCEKRACLDRVAELERRLESESLSYDKLRITTNSVQRKLQSLLQERKDREKQQQNAEQEWEVERRRLLKQIDGVQRNADTCNQKETEGLRMEVETLRMYNQVHREVASDLKQRMDRLASTLADNGLL